MKNKLIIIFILLMSILIISWNVIKFNQNGNSNKLLLVEVISSPHRSKLLRQQLNEFERKHDGVQVEVISLPWGQAYEKLSMMVRGGTVPDVIEMPDFWASRYIKSGLLENLQPSLDASLVKSDFSKELLKYAYLKRQDGLYVIPYGSYLRALIYNKKLFAAAGIKTLPLTFDDFVAVSAKISQLPDKYGFCFHGARGGAVFFYWLATTMNGSVEHFDASHQSIFSKPKVIQALRIIKQMYEKGYFPRDSINWGFNETVAGFYANRCAMLHQSPDALLALKKRMNDEDYASMPMPLGPAGKSFPHLGFIGWSVFKQSMHRKNAWLLLEHLLSKKNNRAWSIQAGIVPVYQDVARHIFSSGEHNRGWYKEIADDRWQYMINPNYLDGIDYFDSVVMIQSAQEMLLGSKTVEEVVAIWSEFLTRAEHNWLKQQNNFHEKEFSDNHLRESRNGSR